MTTAFVDTTVLTDVLLKVGEPARRALSALGEFDRSVLPVYAIKEFKAGPLRRFVWLHNKLASLGSWQQTMSALQAMSRTPQRYLTSTALEALVTGAKTLRMPARTICEKYGADATLEDVLRDRYQIALRVLVFKAWRKRRAVTSEVECDLPCYGEVAPRMNGELIDLDPTLCKPQGECSLAADLKARGDDLQKVFDAIDKKSSRAEDGRRRKALRQLLRKPKEPMSEKMCRDLGDAVFALQAPSGAVILTTNTRDHEPLARALGKEVRAVKVT
jgi:hypothetical protein